MQKNYKNFKFLQKIAGGLSEIRGLTVKLCLIEHVEHWRPDFAGLLYKYNKLAKFVWKKKKFGV